MKRTFIHRIVSFFFALVMIFGVASLMAIGASAAIVDDEKRVSDSVTVSKVSVNTKGFYLVKDTATVRSSTSIFYKKIAVINKGSLVQVSGESGDFFKVRYNINNKNETYFIKKSELKKCANKTDIKQFVYTTKGARALREAPCNEGTKMNLAKGTLLLNAGTLRNEAGNIWHIIYRNGKLFYIYEGNVSSCKKITLSIEGPALMNTKEGEYDFNINVSPKGIGVTVSSSDTAIATVKNNKVTLPGGAGDVTISAEIPGLTKVSVSSTAIIELSTYFQRTNYTCGASSLLTVLHSRGKLLNTIDTDISNSAVTENWIVTRLNKQLGAGTYVHKKVKYCGIEKYESILRNSLRKGHPVILLIAFEKDYFRYTSNGHYVTLIGLVEDENGETWAIVSDSFANRFKSSEYSCSDSGYVKLPLKTLYDYGKKSKSIIYAS